jgi:signal transduction histidine kinase
MADEDLLRRVLVNLISNAMKFTHSEGTVTIAAARHESHASTQDGESLLVSVSDQGEGIPVEDRERIFQKFGQVESRRAGRKMSTGLGLTFCKLAVEAHGGRIWVDMRNRQRQHSHFTIPLSDPCLQNCEKCVEIATGAIASRLQCLFALHVKEADYMNLWFRTNSQNLFFE